MRKGFRLAALLVSAVMALGMSACANEPDLEGSELILDARKAYAELDSARVTMTNEETGEIDRSLPSSMMKRTSACSLIMARTAMTFMHSLITASRI